jgi:WD40-like Beta Propeller Repeat
MTRVLRLLVILLLAVAFPAGAQFGSFGQNKIQYRQFDWRVLKGPHIDLYYYPAEEQLAPVALAYAEQSYDTLALQFGHEVRTRIPLIVYASHSDFEQTNILPFVPPEGLLGVTDFLKRRVTLPFRGNWSEFRHTLRHELVHVFQLSSAFEAYYKNARIGQFRIPLWWSEGLAELWSGGQEPRDEMIMRDITLSGRLPQLEQLEYVTSGIVYPLGGRIHRWLADTYGDWRVALFYQEYWRYESFDDALLASYGRNLKQLNEEWQLAMRREYYPAALDHQPLPLAGQEIARGAIKPAYRPGADTTGEMFYLSASGGYITIRRRPLEGGHSQEVARAGRSADLESFHPFESRVDPSRPGYLLFSSKSHDRDALVIWDLRKNEVSGRYQFDELVSILSPTWGADGRTVIFSGLAVSGISDLYRVTLPEGNLEKLTDDIYQDLDPSVSPDGNQIVFVSDRTAGGPDGAMNLFLLDLETPSLRQLTAGPWIDETPRWAADGRIYFASSRDGVLNVFSLDSLGMGRRETSAWTGAFDPAFVPERNALLVGGFHDLGWNVYLYPADSIARADTFAVETGAPHSEWTWPTIDTSGSFAVRREPYRRKLTLDFAAGEAAVIPGVGGLQGAQFFLSDLLNDQVVLLGIATSQGERFKSIFGSLNISGVYINQSRRLNWGIGAFRTDLSSFSEPGIISYSETTIGALGLLRYPFDRFRRVQAEAIFERSERTDFDFPDGSTIPTASGFTRRGWIASNYISYIQDNSLWVPSGPIDGGRFRITAGVSSDFSNSRFDSYLLNLDIRRYLRLGSRSAYAVRANGWYSGGDRPRRINIGGSLGLRGYPPYGRIVGSRAFLINQEIRFPLLNFLTFGTPAGAVTFPELQGAFFFDVGKAWFREPSDRSLLGSYGGSLRWALAPFLVLRMDVGRRFTDGEFTSYPLTARQRKPGFISFYFGYNY